MKDDMAETSPIPTVTGADIIAGLRELGLTRGAGVMVHSSLKSFGRVEGGARTVIAALMEVITPAGTLMMPSFNHGRAFEEGQPGYYDPRETPTSNGAIPDLFWRMPERPAQPGPDSRLRRVGQERPALHGVPSPDSDDGTTVAARTSL